MKLGIYGGFIVSFGEFLKFGVVMWLFFCQSGADAVINILCIASIILIERFLFLVKKCRSMYSFYLRGKTLLSTNNIISSALKLPEKSPHNFIKNLQPWQWKEKFFVTLLCKNFLLPVIIFLALFVRFFKTMK